MPLFVPPNKGLYRYRHTGVGGAASGPTTSRYYIAGALAPGNLASTFSAVVGQSVAIPFYTGAASVLESVNVRVVTAVSSSTCHVAIYTNTSDSALYPAARLGFSTDLSTAATGFVGYQMSLPVPPETLIWVVFQASHAIGVTSLSPANQWALLGHNLDTTNYVYAGSAWLGTGTYTTPPATFQTDATANLAASVPAIWLRFSS